jgi:hypothetical protein
MLTVAQKNLVQESFKTIAPIADDAAQLFYQRLFELDPSLRHMFRGDMKEQRKKLMQMITAAKGLDGSATLPVVGPSGDNWVARARATTPSVPRSSGRLKWASAARSRPRSRKRGRRCTGSWRAR